MLTVNGDRDVVERQLGGGELAAADAVAAVAAAAAAAVMVPGVSGVARWELASAVTCGLLLAPSWPAGRANASWLWAAASGAGILGDA
jgi:hypothetical protein